MIRPSFLDSESRRDLIELARDGSAAHRLARRANTLVLLDKGMSCRSVAEARIPEQTGGRGERRADFQARRQFRLSAASGSAFFRARQHVGRVVV
jgi:hypothetical protein